MFWFVIGVILAIIALLIFGFAPSKYEYTIDEEKRDPYTREVTPKKTGIVNLKKLTVIPLVLAIFFILISTLTVVGTRNSGVVSVFNKPTGETLPAGLHMKLPWEKVTDIDASIKVVEYFGDDAIQVKIADGGDAKISVSYRWRINPDAADKVFQDYRNSDLDIEDAIRKALVSTNVKSAINEEFGKYDPLSGANLENLTPEQLATAEINVVPDYEAFNAAIQTNVEAKIANLGDLVDIQSITISAVQLPENTQNRINAFNAAVQDTKIALQEVATKQAQAEGNNQLAASLQDPNVLVSKCFDALAAGQFVLPAGGSCWPGGGSGVVIPSK